MEIVIENPGSTSPTNPGIVVHPHIHRPCSNRSIYGTDLTSTSSGVNYYATLPPRLRNHHIVPGGSDLDGASTTSSVRRVDRSGLLEISDLEPPRNRSRHLTGAENLGTLSRRVDRSGLLEAVPEVPDQCQGGNCASDELSESDVNNRCSIIDRHLTGAEINKKTLSPRLLRSPIESLKRRSFESVEEVNSPTVSSSNLHPRYQTISKSLRSTTKLIPSETSSSVTATTQLDITKENNEKTFSNSPLPLSRPCSRNSSINETTINDIQDYKEMKPDCLGRISPRLRNDRHSPMTLSSIPDVIEAHGSSASNSQTRNEVGERAEAEGCEHTAIESLEESRVSFKTSQKILHNDNIQAVHVFILSEQL
ncbi:uncharacterized protein LOC127281573 [Leptopilina boulardi]|uniref:uncharacterized protein LOC127281573 n=1 Tax=Leptopilina boulardi TaxID=63433 RepID=UPI0021F5B058|nr:uncharacterized protein LOC127281573 [Leptopilina boulardi]